MRSGCWARGTSCAPLTSPRAPRARRKRRARASARRRESIGASVIADLSSIAPESARKFSEMAAARGIIYMDCPVSGGVGGAAAGTLTVMAGGPDRAFLRMRPLFETIGRKICHIGPVGFEGGFAVDLEYKDLGLAVETAKQLSMPIPMGSTAVQMFEAARAKGFGRQDITSLLKIWEELMDTEVR